jgi:hypothetical protein
MQHLNFKAFLEAEENEDPKEKQGDFITALTSVLGINPKHIGDALKGTSPIMMSQKVFDKRQVGLVPCQIEPNKNKSGAKITIMSDESPYVYVKDRLNKNAKKRLKAFVNRDGMDKLYTLGFPGSEGPPEGEAGAAPPDMGGAIT